jgi:hypothetical protein
MPKVIPFPDCAARRPKRLKYPFEIIQTETPGIVAIDAIVPFQIAFAMLKMLEDEEKKKSSA